MIRDFLALSAIVLTACSASGPKGAPQSDKQEASVQAELVAVEFTGVEANLDCLSAEVVWLGWRIKRGTSERLRITPPSNYEPSQFGRLLERINALGISDIGLQLIGPDGPVGPEG